MIIEVTDRIVKVQSESAIGWAELPTNPSPYDLIFAYENAKMRCKQAEVPSPAPTPATGFPALAINTQGESPLDVLTKWTK